MSKILKSLRTKQCFLTFKLIKRLMSTSDTYKSLILPDNIEAPPPTYGGRHTITLLLGAGIGPRLIQYTREVLESMGAPVDFQEIQIVSNKDINKELENIITALKRNGVALKSNLGYFSEMSVDVEIRNNLELSEFVVHIKSLPNLPSKQKDIDLIIVRQNTGAEFSMIEHGSVKGLVTSLKILTRKNAEKVLRFAFEYAKLHNRKKVTIVHKANIIKLSDGLFLQCAKELAKEYPDIKHDDIIIDNCCMQIVSNPKQFDVIVTLNLYGMIITNILCGLTGGPGLMSGMNIGKECVIFEPAVRTVGLDIAKEDIANPVAMLNAACDMLHYIGSPGYSSLLRNAIHDVICMKKIRTKDIGGTFSTKGVVDAIIKYVEQHSVTDT